ncbi:hypothetical protein [Williamsia sp. CHRR-6]|uniref:hypothetical protein n=1 Tax=Williamsia sp. CHRR-6 TaxID=2835871 RepID=UPI001BDA7BDA|nr:hypothetical protein [Williamsia sp. CHRR-6]MBT0565813.1 hypothetical protein [Williamsia sp. CHRR-6]
MLRTLRATPLSPLTTPILTVVLTLDWLLLDAWSTALMSAAAALFATVGIGIVGGRHTAQAIARLIVRVDGRRPVSRSSRPRRTRNRDRQLFSAILSALHQPRAPGWSPSTARTCC